MDSRWIASWTAAPMDIAGTTGAPPGFFGQTIREVARVSVGGNGLVLRLTNEFGTMPLTLDAVEVAMAGEGGQVEPLTTRAVTFGGSRLVTIPPGCPMLSDPIDMNIDPLSRLAVSYYTKGFVPLSTGHPQALQTAFISVPGNFAAAERMIVQQTFVCRYLLSGIYVKAPPEARAIICFGDSITDGDGSTVDADRRWPDLLAERLQQTPGFENVAVLNSGIGGNRLMYDRAAQKGLQRFDRDVARLAGASHLLVLIGINDIVFPNTVLIGSSEPVSAADLIGGLQQIVTRARLGGIRTLLGTIMPFEDCLPDTPLEGCYTEEKEAIREAVNRWIREAGCADGIVDFDAVMRDPDHPKRLLPRYDSGDHIHPCDVGYRVMASAVDLSLIAYQ
jgi:lysophospholipase L1-like esterase